METKEKFLTIDPPRGWLYGFPKKVTQEEYESIKNLKQWCINNGYPQTEADSYGSYFHIQINGFNQDYSKIIPSNDKPLSETSETIIKDCTDVKSSEKFLYAGKSLEYWRENAEEDYVKTPISVLKYITVLEEFLKDSWNREELLGVLNDSFRQDSLSRDEYHQRIINRLGL